MDKRFHRIPFQLQRLGAELGHHCAQARHAGFTLIELMIVILVILVLAAILIPQFGLARERANKAKCVSNQRNLETSMAMWATDNPNITYTGGTLDKATPNFSALTGSGGGPQYSVPGAFQEPDDPTATNDQGQDYYLSAGAATGSAANPSAPSYGHVACAYDGVTDPWVNNYDPKGAGANLTHTRGASASP